jgi:hypothetical protein
VASRFATDFKRCQIRLCDHQQIWPRGNARHALAALLNAASKVRRIAQTANVSGPLLENAYCVDHLLANLGTPKTEPFQCDCEAGTGVTAPKGAFLPSTPSRLIVRYPSLPST